MAGTTAAAAVLAGDDRGAGTMQGPEPGRAGAGAALLLNSVQAAAVLGVSRATFWMLHSAGKVPSPVRLSERVVRWRRAELAAWIAAGCPNRDQWKKILEKSA